MATIVTRAGKGAPLTHNEVDANFTNLNSDKVETSAISAFGATLIDDADAAAARATLGLGTAATTASTDYATAAQGSLADSATQPGDNVSTLTNDAGYAASLSDLGVTATTDNLNATQFLTGRNKIINGNFDIWQRGTSFGNPSSTAYNADRWWVSYNGSGASRTISRQAFTVGQTDVPYEPTYFLRFDQSVGGSGASFNAVSQKIENVRTFAGQTVTLSFWAKAASSLTMPNIYLRQAFGTGGSPSSSVDVVLDSSISVSTSWTKYTYTATLGSISGKTLGADNNTALEVYFFLPVNTTFTFDIAQVQLEAGDVATPFDVRPIGQELALCQRYYFTHAGERRFAARNNGTFRVLSYDFPSTMRAVPSITLGSVVGASFSATASSVTTTGFDVEGVTSGAGDLSGLTSIEADAEL